MCEEKNSLCKECLENLDRNLTQQPTNPKTISGDTGGGSL